MARNDPIRVSRRAFAAMWNDPSVTTDQIAATFGMHRSSVSPTGKRFGLHPRSLGAKPEINREPFASWWTAGVAGRDICKAMGLCRNYPGVLAKRFGLEPRPKFFRAKLSLADFQGIQLRLAMETSARETQGALMDAEMVDNRQAGRWPLKRAA